MKRIHVVAGILRDAQGRVLLAQRGTGKHLEGLWEFPGGKVDPGESPIEALRRELHEEIGVEVDAAVPLISVPWRYPDRRVELEVREVTAWRGEPRGREGQAIAWCAPEAMHGFEMPAADRPVVAALRLPRRMLVTPARGLDDPVFAARLERAFGAGLRMVQLRAPGLDAASLEAVAARLQKRCAAHGATLVVNGSIELARRLGLGLHLGAAAARAHAARPLGRDRWFGVSAHDATELAHARLLDADYVVLGPVRETASHPGARALGWARFATLARELPLPCYAIGGLGPDELELARAHRAFGVAGIRAFLPR